jgi:hydrogenase small subunit
MSNVSKKELRTSIVSRLSQHLEVETLDDWPPIETLGDRLANSGVSRRSFMKYCMGLSAMMAIPISLMPKLVEAALAKKTSVVYLSFQECTGCLESLVNVFSNTRYNLLKTNLTADISTDSIANILLTALSLDYSETLMAPSGLQAEKSKADAIANTGYILVVDGAIPDDKKGAGFFIQHGKTGLQLLKEAATNAAAVVSVGTCASFGGLPAAKGPDNLNNPGNLRGVSPTGATSIKTALDSFGGIYKTKPVINVSGCPPIAEVIAGTLVYWILNGKAPSLDSNLRPTMFYGETVHEECYRKEFFEEGQFVNSFDDAGARAGHCLLMMGCKGPTTHNACTTLKWNQGTGYPMEAGHGCLGCSEPDFWDKKSINAQGQQGVGFYNHLDPATIRD